MTLPFERNQGCENRTSPSSGSVVGLSTFLPTKMPEKKLVGLQNASDGKRCCFKLTQVASET